MKSMVLSNRKFGKLTVIDRYDNKNWNCQCECGNKKIVLGASLTTGRTRSCGCLKKFGVPLNLIGRKFGRLTPKKCLGRKRNISKSPYHWECLCDCGKRKNVSVLDLTSGNTRSCGCLNQEERSKRRGKNHPRWNNSLSDKERFYGRKYDVKFKIWSKLVKQKYNYTCQKCGQYQGKIVSHHIKGWKNNLNLRYIISNGICLCVKCHKEFHRRYGYTKNMTIENFKIFMKEKINANSRA